MHSVHIQRQAGPSLHLRMGGSGRPMCLLIHGHGDGGYVWDEIAAVLAPLYSVVVPDLRGHGESGWDRAGRYSVAEHVADVMHIIRTLGREPLVLLGHSLGGEIATHIAARYPDRIAAAALIDFGPDFNPEGARETMRMLTESLKTYPTIGSYVDWLGARRPLVAPERLESLAARALEPRSDGYRLRIDPAVTRVDIAEETPEANLQLWRMLEDISCPVLAVRGSGSAILSQDSVNRMVRTLRRGRLVVIEAAGHAVMSDNPKELAEAIVQFMREVGGKLPPRQGLSAQR